MLKNWWNQKRNINNNLSEDQKTENDISAQNLINDQEIEKEKEIDWSKFESCSKKRFRKHNIVFIHGFTSNMQTHDSIFKKFIKRGYSYYSFNLPGHGKTDFNASNSDLTIVHYAELVIKFIVSKKIKNIILIGHSMGGAIAVMVHSFIPELIHLLILEDPLNKSIFSSKKERIKVLFEKNEEGKKNWLHPVKFIRNTYKNDQRYKSLLLNMISSRTTKTISEAYQQIGYRPTLLIFGKDDNVIFAENSVKEISKYALNLDVRIIPNAKHSPSQQQPELYYKLIANFIKNNKKKSLYNDFIKMSSKSDIEDEKS